ncbi:MAG: VWA domain-containing protein [Clostridiales bacterium]|nr:VWA domain-containing protein [Clostridiales bacterium]
MKRILAVILSLILAFNSLAIVAFAETYDHQVQLNVERSFSTVDSEGNPLETNKMIIDYLDPTKNTIDINYKISFDPIIRNTIPVTVPEKEVVLVLDRSGSMAWDLAGKSKSSSGYSGPDRMSILKDAATTFVDKLSENPKLKLSVISYSSSSTVFERNSMKLIDISNGTVSNSTTNKNREAIKDHINDMNASGGTNVGDAMRKGYQLLDTSESSDDAEKYFVFLSDGEPSFYSYQSYTSNRPDEKYRIEAGKDNYYYTGTNVSPSTNSSNDYSKGKKYAELMAPELNVFKKNYFLAFNTSSSNELENIAKLVNSQLYQQAETTDEINTVYDEISEEILALLNLESVSFTDTLPVGLTIDTTVEGFNSDRISVDGQSFTYNIDSVNYKLNEAGTHYVAEPVEFTVKANYGEVGTYVFTDTDGRFSYKDIDGVVRVKNAGPDTFTVERNPVKNVTATRPQEEGENPDNNVLVAWDNYTGAKEYKVYKVVNGVDVEVGTVKSDTTSLLVPITVTDGAETTYKVQAVLINGKLSGTGEDKSNTVPSILNLTVERENNTFIVSWDQIADETNVKYNILPIIEPPKNDDGEPIINDKANPTDDDVFTLLNKRVSYRYDLEDPETYLNYTDEIKFTVDAIKKDKTSGEDIDANEATSEPVKIRQVVKTIIETDLSDFNYAKTENIKVNIVSDAPFPVGVNLYDPMIVVELLLPNEVSDTPLEFTYPTLKLYNVDSDGVETAVRTTVISSTKGDVKLYIQLDDYTNTFFVPGTDLNLYLDYSVAYKSINGKLDVAVLNELRKVNSGLVQYQIENQIRKLLNQFYTTDIDKLLVMKTYFMYNTAAKNIDDPTMRDEKVGISTGYINIKDIKEIDDEF